MQIEIKEDVFRTSNFRALNYLIQICLYKDRYSLFVDLGKVNRSESFKQLSQIDQMTIEQQFNDTLQKVYVKPQIKVSEQKQSIRFFSVDEAARFLVQPVSIVLENSLNDGYFIRAIIKYISKNSKLETHLDNGWLQFENAGGNSNVLNYIRGKLQSYNSLPKEKHHYLRCYVILDSDKEYPSAVRKNEYNLLIQDLATLNVKAHILEKRSMENYLPTEVYPYLKAKMPEKFIDAFLSLSPTQIDYFNIQLGFQVTNRTELRADIAALFLSISDANFEILKKGSGLGNFKSEFPKFMEHHQVHKQTLKNRTAHQTNADELDNILKDIETLL